MKPIHNILLSVFLVAAIISVTVYTACKKDKCNHVVCLNLGSCDNGNCKCPVGYEGLRCDTLSRDKFIFVFNGGDSCGSYQPWDQYQLLFLEVPNAPLQITLKHILNNWDDSAICTMQSTDSFTFIGSNNSTHFSGHGKLYHDTLKLKYAVQVDTTNFNCTYTGGR